MYVFLQLFNTISAGVSGPGKAKTNVRASEEHTTIGCAASGVRRSNTHSSSDLE